MNEYNEKIPNPRELEKEISEFLKNKFGDNVKLVSPKIVPQEKTADKKEEVPEKKNKIVFDLKPEELIFYLDRYIIKQESAKAILATKICTHFNRIKRYEDSPDDNPEMVGGIKNNVLMIGPTGVGKTYMVKLIANKIGVPFVKGDATKFSETGYVGGDVEDLVRSLVAEAGDDLELAQYGIVYIDEIDKIASGGNMSGGDISRTGVQRALLKPMEETDVELRAPHDQIAMMQELERFRKTGQRDTRTVSTQKILFIMSGAFSDLHRIIKKRISNKTIGFGSQALSPKEQFNILKNVKTEDLVNFGFESEFIGRLPVKAIFERLTEDDFFQILKNPNNPVILGKKLDFGAYGINIRFDDNALNLLAKSAFEENTGARGLVSAIESALLPFEKKLPSTNIKQFPVTPFIIENPQKALDEFLAKPDAKKWAESFEEIISKEKEFIKEYLLSNGKSLCEKIDLNLTPFRADWVATYYSQHVTDIQNAIKKIKLYYDETQKVEVYFYNKHDIKIVLEEDALDYIAEQFINSSSDFQTVCKRISKDFEHGFKLIREKTGSDRFYVSEQALLSPESFLSNVVDDELSIPSSQRPGAKSKKKP